MSAPQPSRCVFAIVIPTALLSALAPPGCDSPAPKPPARKPATKYDEEYLAALAAANEFCHAWRQGDVAAGRPLLSPRIKRTFPDSRIRDVISGTPNARHVAFEISAGSRGADGSIAFRVRLFHRYTGRAEDRIEGPVQSIVMQPDGAGRWLVDRFPLLEEPESPEAVIR
jgi:hypothetical protein